MFHSTLQYSLINWGRACQTHLHKIEVLQNKIIRTSLFRLLRYPTNLLYAQFGVLRLEDMINMEFAKFLYKFNNKLLLNLFD